MNIDQSKLEWTIADEHADKKPTCALPETKRRPYWLDVCAGFVALCLIVAGGWLWLQAETGVEQVETELQDAAQAELWVAAHHDVELAIDLAADPLASTWHRQFARDDSTLSTLQAVEPGSPLVVDLRVVELETEWAKVQMIASAGEADAYRQTRFYRQTVDNWLRTAPAAERWGTPDQLESTYFIFEFRQKDAEVVAEVAPQLDALYDALRSNLGLAMSSGDAKVVVEISPTELPGAALLRSAAEHFVVPSPILYLAPASVTDAELILQSLALLLVGDVLDEAIARNDINWVLPHMVSALHLWQLWDLDLPLASRREEIVQWRLTGVAAGNQEEAALPYCYPELCALYSVWLPSPTLISIPLNCDKRDLAPMYAPSPDALSTAELEQLTTNIFWQAYRPMDNTHSIVQAGDTVILTTLVEYIVSRYGREQLPVMLAALGQHKSWATLSPALFGVSSAEFAAGWHEYLVVTYNLSGTY